MSDLRNAHLYNFGGGLTEWGKKIRALRIRKNVLLGEMAKDLNVRTSYLSGVECGRNPQEPEFMKRCEDYLNALPDDKENIKHCGELNEWVKGMLEQTPEQKAEFERGINFGITDWLNKGKEINQ